MARRKSESVMKVESGAVQLTFQLKGTDRVTYPAIWPSGEIVMEIEGESMEVSFNGRKVPQGPTK